MATNKKPLYIPWNDEEFNADPRVRGMNHYQRWMYRSLLQACFWTTDRPNLPNDDEQLWVLAGCESLEEWSQNKDKVLRRFTVVEIEGVSVLQNKRVVADWERLMDVRGRMAEMGQKSAAVRNPNTLDQIPRTLNDGLTTVKPTLNVGCMPALLTANVPVTCVEQEKISEVKKSQGKGSEVKEKQSASEEKETHSNSGGQVVQSGVDLASGATAPDPVQKPDFKTFRITWERLTSNRLGHGKEMEVAYVQACQLYSPVVVLDAVERFATKSMIDWLKEHNLKSWFLYFVKSKLPEIALEMKDDVTRDSAMIEAAAVVESLPAVATPEKQQQIEDLILMQALEEQSNRKARTEKFAAPVEATNESLGDYL